MGHKNTQIMENLFWQMVIQFFVAMVEEDLHWIIFIFPAHE